MDPRSRLNRNTEPTALPDKAHQGAAVTPVQPPFIDDTELPLSPEAHAKLLRYAKGDEEKAAELLFAATEIALRQGWREVPVEAVKAALLQYWTRHAAAVSSGSRLKPSRSDPESSPPLPDENGSRNTRTRASGRNEPRPREGEIAALGPEASAPAPPLGRGLRSPPANAASEGDAVDADHTEPSGWLAALTGDRFSYGTVAFIAGLAVVLAIVLFSDPDHQPLPDPISIPPLVLIDPPAVEGANPPASAPEPAAPNEAKETPKDRPPTGQPPLHDVREAQTLLAQLGYSPGSVDGKMGPMTEAAVRAFQRDIQSRVDGGITPLLLRQLRDRAVAATPPAEIVASPPADKTPATSSRTTLRTIGRWLGATYDSRRNPAAVEAHCLAVPDNWIFDEAAGDLVHCSRFVAGHRPPAPARHDP